MGTVDPHNRLNELSAQEWLRFTKTWFVHNPPRRKEKEILHPAKFPEDLIEQFITFFTKPGAVVVDPFAGTGSTLVAAYNTRRNGIGIELQKKYADIARERLQKLDGQFQLSNDGCEENRKQLVLEGNSAEVEKFWRQYGLPMADLVVTSPPYGLMLHKKGLISKDREEKGLDTAYSYDKEDLGNAEDYDQFLQKLVDIFITLKPFLKEDSYLVVILQNYMDKGEYKPLAWDFASRMMKHYTLRGEKIWCQDNKTLFPYGYKYSFVPNVHHHYCLIFRKDSEKV
ncbi:MAG: DNA methyltransferase [Nanoarchaeota archaeon]|nr:DNA methyltransferase [Nanoarchaeota archaeon]